MQKIIMVIIVARRIMIDDKINSELEYIMRNLEQITGQSCSKPKAVRFLIRHYNENKNTFKRKPRTKDDWIFV